MSLDKVLNSSLGKKFCTYVSNPKNERFINSAPSVAQQFIAEVTGVCIVAFNKKIEPEQKKSQLIQHGMKAIANLTIISGVANATSKFADNVVSKLPKSIDASITKGIKIGFPLVSSVLFARLFIPMILNPVSSKLRDIYNEKFEKKDKNTDKMVQNRHKYVPLTFENYIKATKLDVKA